MTSLCSMWHSLDWGQEGSLSNWLTHIAGRLCWLTAQSWAQSLGWGSYPGSLSSDCLDFLTVGLVDFKCWHSKRTRQKRIALSWLSFRSDKLLLPLHSVGLTVMKVHLGSRVGDRNSSWWESNKPLERHMRWKICLWLSWKNKICHTWYVILSKPLWMACFLICKIKRWTRNSKFQT